MPTYEYRCTQCGHLFERFQSMNDHPLSACPACEGKVKRLIGAGAGLIFKGSGFYATDYGRKNGGGEAKRTEKGEVAAPAPNPAASSDAAGATPAASPTTTSTD